MIYLSKVLASSSSESTFSYYFPAFFLNFPSQIEVKSASKILHKIVLESSLEVSEDLSAAIWMPIGPILRAGEDQWSIWSARPPPAHLPHTSRTPPGHLPDVISEAQPRAAGLPKRLKNAFVAQKVVSGSVSGDNSCRLWGYHRFGLIF